MKSSNINYTSGNITQCVNAHVYTVAILEVQVNENIYLNAIDIIHKCSM